MRVKAAVFYGPRRIKLENRDISPPLKEEAIIKVKYVGICGSDVSVFYGEYGHPVPTPIIMGHEFSGEIKEIDDSNYKKLQVGDQVVVETTFSCGDCLLCKKGKQNLCKKRKRFGRTIDGALAEFIKIPIRQIYKIPPNVKLDEAAMNEPLSVALHAVKRAEIEFGNSVAIIGAGTIGILIGQLAKIAGAFPIFVIDKNPHRLSVASKYGMKAINNNEENYISVIEKETKGEGVNVIFDAAGALQIFSHLYEISAAGVKIVVVSIFRQPATIDLYQILLREATITTSRLFTPEDFKVALKMIAEKKVDVSSLITHRVNIDQIEKGMEIMHKAENALRVLVSVE